MPRDLPEAIQSRREGVARWVERLSMDEVALVRALEGRWPAAMVREGLSAHRETWGAVDRLVSGLQRELAGLGGFDALDGWSSAADGRQIHLRVPREVAHIWPNLPGAGVTPVLYGALLGIDQSIHPPSGGGEWAEKLVEHWNGVDALPSLEILPSDGDGWLEADVVVASGGDETLRAIRRRVEEEGRDRGTLVAGYGHRVSFGVVPEDDTIALEAVADGMARDVVLWNQAGCFSLRGVLVAGSRERQLRFCRMLGSKIADREEELDAVPDADSEDSTGLFERRLQARQVAEFEDRVHGDGFGWVEPREEPFGGDWVSLHTVTCHRVDGPREVATAVEVQPWHLQGVACPAADSRTLWRDALADVGVTRICEPGELQAPPPDWLHDGQWNAADWLRATTLDGPRDS